MSNPNVNVVVSGPKKDYTSTYKTYILRGNMDFASQVTEPNRKYVIKYDFDLGGETVTIPEGCVLEFDGGSILNGDVNCNQAFVILNNYDGANLYNTKQSKRTTRIKIYDSLNTVSVKKFNINKPLIQSASKHGYDGFIYCIDLDGDNLSYSDGATNQDIYDAINYGKLIGFPCHAIKVHCAAASSIDIYLNKVLQLAQNVKNNCGLIDYFAIGNEYQPILNPTGPDAESVISKVLSCVDDLKDMGYSVLLNQDVNHIDDEYLTNKNYNPTLLSLNLYQRVGGVYKARSEKDVVDALGNNILKIKNLIYKCDKKLIITEYGILPYEGSLYEPGNWRYWELGEKKDDNVPYIYIKGLFDSDLNNVINEVWLWFTNTLSDNTFEMLKRLTGNKI